MPLRPSTSRAETRESRSAARKRGNKEFQIVVMGSGGVGKSALTARFVYGEFTEGYDPTIEDSYRTTILVDGKAILVEILDTAGAEQFVNMRDLYIKSGQAFVLVFSLNSLLSFEEMKECRADILRIKEDDNVPFVVVGNKCDLGQQREVDLARAYALCQKWGCPYYETSARLGINVREVFVDLCRQKLWREQNSDFWLGEGDDDQQLTPPKSRLFNLRRSRHHDDGTGGRRHHRHHREQPHKCVVV